MNENDQKTEKIDQNLQKNEENEQKPIENEQKPRTRIKNSYIEQNEMLVRSQLNRARTQLSREKSRKKNDPPRDGKAWGYERPVCIYFNCIRSFAELLIKVADKNDITVGSLIRRILMMHFRKNMKVEFTTELSNRQITLIAQRIKEIINNPHTWKDLLDEKIVYPTTKEALEKTEVDERTKDEKTREAFFRAESIKSLGGTKRGRSRAGRPKKADSTGTEEEADIFKNIELPEE